MDPAHLKRKIIDLSEEELVAFGYLGENVVPGIRRLVEQVRADPDHLGNMTCSIVELFKKNYPPPPSRTPSAPAATSEAEILYSQLINDPEARAVVSPDLVSEYEMNFWYYGVYGNPHKLLWRSDFETNPFPIPASGTPFSKIPNKIVHGITGWPINDLWDELAPKILVSMKARGLEHSALEPVRFSTVTDDRETFGPIVLWIALRPNTAYTGAVRDATADILRILADAQITDVLVEWYYEQPAVKPANPSLASAVNNPSLAPSRSA